MQFALSHSTYSYSGMESGKVSHDIQKVSRDIQGVSSEIKEVSHEKTGQVARLPITQLQTFSQKQESRTPHV